MYAKYYYQIFMENNFNNIQIENLYICVYLYVSGYFVFTFLNMLNYDITMKLLL